MPIKLRKKNGECAKCTNPRKRHSGYCKEHHAQWQREYRKRNSPTEFWKMIDEKDSEIEILKAEIEKISTENIKLKKVLFLGEIKA